MADARPQALALSPDNGLIQFVTAPDRKVIKEIDRDPHSPGFGRTSREYTYVGDRVVALTAYKYLGDRIEVARTMVSYHPDGSIDQYRESAEYQPQASRR